jgi:hypothetical protein
MKPALTRAPPNLDRDETHASESAAVASATGRSVNASTPPHFGDVVESRSRGNAIRPPTARDVAMATDGVDDDVFNAAPEAEFRASLLAVAASAFAVDAFYASVVEAASDARVRARTRDGRIFETLRRAFDLTPGQRAALHEPSRIVFRLRDEAVHPPAVWAEPALHPIFNLGMEPRYVSYCAERTRSTRNFWPGR